MRKVLSFIISVLFIWWGTLFTACDDTESFTSDRSTLLHFSTDTIRFDTVISTIGSSTRQLMVYNPNGKGVRIASVRLKKGADTPFRVNVDGSYLERESGARAYDFEVRKGDSIRVFAEVTMPENGRDEPAGLTDTLIFTLESGVEQGVILTAVAQDAYLWRGKVIAADTTLTSGRPFLIYDSLTVAEGATLTLTEGVQLYFHDGGELRVRGRLVAEGTLQAPVVFRGDRTDRMFDYLPYDNTPSRWWGVRFYESSMDNHLNHIDLHSASNIGITCDSSATDRTKLTVENSVIHNVGGYGLALYHCRTLVANTQISNTLYDCVAVYGGWAEFVHCTLAQFYPWDAGRGTALFLSNIFINEDYPLEHARFLNCLITGYADDVVMGNLDDPDDNLPYSFENCLLRTVESDDAVRFVNIKYDPTEDEGGRQKQFRRFDTDNFLYDFRLLPEAPALHVGAAEGAGLYPFDRYGVSRQSGEAPDAGCYQYQPEEE